MWAASLLILQPVVSPESRMEALLERALRPVGIDVVATVMQRDSRGDGTHRMVRMIRAKDGRLATLVLSPSSHEGTASVDDGVRMRTYVPGSGRIVEGPSGLESAEKSHVRMVRAAKNYSFVDGGGTVVAGRRALLVIARPRHRGMPERRYALDRLHAYPLRLELVTDGKPVVQYEARSVTFGSLPDDAFVLRTRGPVRMESLPTPSPMPVDHCREKLGFMPLMPRRLPMGFSIEESLAMGDRRRKMVAVRLTDGLVRATVYMMPDPPEDVKWPLDTRAAEGVRILLGSDLPPATREALLHAFATGRKIAELPGPIVE